MYTINYCAHILKPSDYIHVYFFYGRKSVFCCILLLVEVRSRALLIFFFSKDLDRFRHLLIRRKQLVYMANQLRKHLGALYITYLNASMHRVHICYHIITTSLVDLQYNNVLCRDTLQNGDRMA